MKKQIHFEKQGKVNKLLEFSRNVYAGHCRHRHHIQRRLELTEDTQNNNASPSDILDFIEDILRFI